MLTPRSNSTHAFWIQRRQRQCLGCTRSMITSRSTISHSEWWIGRLVVFIQSLAGSQNIHKMLRHPSMYTTTMLPKRPLRQTQPNMCKLHRSFRRMDGVSVSVRPSIPSMPQDNAKCPRVFVKQLLRTLRCKYVSEGCPKGSSWHGRRNYHCGGGFCPITLISSNGSMICAWPFLAASILLK